MYYIYIQWQPWVYTRSQLNNTKTSCTTECVHAVIRSNKSFLYYYIISIDPAYYAAMNLYIVMHVIMKNYNNFKFCSFKTNKVYITTSGLLYPVSIAMVTSSPTIHCRVLLSSSHELTLPFLRGCSFGLDKLRLSSVEKHVE